MKKYFSYLIILNSLLGQDNFSDLSFSRNLFYDLPTKFLLLPFESIPNKNSILINSQLVIYKFKNNKSCLNISKEYCMHSEMHPDDSKFNEKYDLRMGSLISETPECIFSFYSSLAYGR